MEAIGVIVAFIVFGFLLQFLFGGIERLFNGKKQNDPIDINMQILKSIKANSYDKLKNRIEKANAKSLPASEKLRLLKEIEGLKKQNALTETEYNKLRNDIMK